MPIVIYKETQCLQIAIYKKLNFWEEYTVTPLGGILQPGSGGEKWKSLCESQNFGMLASTAILCMI